MLNKLGQPAATDGESQWKQFTSVAGNARKHYCSSLVSFNTRYKHVWVVQHVFVGVQFYIWKKSTTGNNLKVAFKFATVWVGQPQSFRNKTGDNSIVK